MERCALPSRVYAASADGPTAACKTASLRIYVALAFLAAVFALIALPGVGWADAAEGTYEATGDDAGTYSVSDDGNGNNYELTMSIVTDDNGAKTMSVTKASVTDAGNTEGDVDIVVPATITVNGESLPVTTIAGGSKTKGAFYQTAARSLTAESVTTLEAYAFYDADFQTISLPKVTAITATAVFEYCSSLTSINLPALESISGTKTFGYCTSLVTVSFPALTEITGNYTFCDSTSAGSCTALESVDCPKLAKVTGTNVFRNCTALKSISLPSLVSGAYNNEGEWEDYGVGSAMFYGCSSLVIDAKSFPKLSELGTNMFQNCTAITGVVDDLFPAGLTEVANYAFYGCTGITSVSLAKVTSLGSYAFYGCTALASLNLPALATLGTYAFYGCTSITGAIDDTLFPAGLTEVPANAFRGCTGITSVSLAKVTSLGSYAFYGCTGITSVNFPSLTEIGTYAFYGCTALESVDLPYVTTISSGATVSSATSKVYTFYGCTSLKTVNLPLVTVVGAYTFDGCTSLVSVTMPSVTLLGNYAFHNCTSLESFVLEDSTVLAIIGSNVFQNCSSLKSFAFPSAATVTTVGTYAFNGCTSLEEVTLSPKIKTIPSSAFTNCTSLHKITILYPSNTSKSGLVYYGAKGFVGVGADGKEVQVWSYRNALGITEWQGLVCTGNSLYLVNSDSMGSTSTTTGNNFMSYLFDAGVAYDLGGGTLADSGLSTSSTYETGTQITLPTADQVVRDGYVLTGWTRTLASYYYDSEGTVQEDTYLATNYASTANGAIDYYNTTSYAPGATYVVGNVYNTIFTAEWTPVVALESTASGTGTATYGDASDSVTVSVSATPVSGYEVAGYQWYRVSDDGSGDVAISGATSASYTVATSGLDAGTYYYYCVVEAKNTATGATTKLASDSVAVTVEKATPSLGGVTASLTYGQTLADSTVSGTATYNGTTVAGAWAWSNGSTLPEVSDSGSSYEVTFTPTDTTNYTSVTGQIALTVTAKELATSDVTVNTSDLNWTGEAITLGTSDISVKYGDTLLEYGTDYEISGYANNTEIGTATCTIAFKGNYSGTAQAAFSIVSPGTYTVSFADGGASGTVPASYDQAGGILITLPSASDLSLEGAVFSGWTCSADTSGTLYQAGDSYRMPASDVTFTAQWEQVIASVSAQGATVSYGDSSATVSVEASIASGYDTVSYQWYQVANNTATAVAGATSASYTVATSGLDAGTYSYYCVVRAANGNGAAATYTSDPVSVVVTQKTGEVSFGNAVSYTSTAYTVTLNEAATANSGDTVRYLISTSNATPSASSGDWQDSLTFSGLSAGTTYYVFAMVGETTNYTSAISSALVVSTASVGTIEEPTLSAITYDPTTTLADVPINSTDTYGTWAWADSTTVPTVNVTSYAAVYTPTADALALYDYSSLAGYSKAADDTVTITFALPLTVNKATPTLSGVSATAITYGDSLSASTISGTATVGSTAVSGSWAWSSTAYYPTVDDSNTTGYAYVFTPSDTANINTATGTVSLGVSGLDISGNIAVTVKNQVYAGQAVELDADDVTVTYGGIELVYGTDYDIAATDNEAIGTATYTVTLKGNYAGSVTGTFEITEMATYTVTFAAGDGAEGDVPTMDAQEEGAVITLPSADDLTLDGYTFVGWLCSVDGLVYAAGDEYTMTAADTTFTAQWVGESNSNSSGSGAAATTYTVTFSLSDGVEGDVPTMDAQEEGAVITLPSADDLTLDGYTFVGWLCSVDGLVYEAGAEYTMTAEDTVFTDLWISNADATEDDTETTTSDDSDDSDDSDTSSGSISSGSSDSSGSSSLAKTGDSNTVARALALAAVALCAAAVCAGVRRKTAADSSADEGSVR